MSRTSIPTGSLQERDSISSPDGVEQGDAYLLPIAAGFFDMPPERLDRYLTVLQAADRLARCAAHGSGMGGLTPEAAQVVWR